MDLDIESLFNKYEYTNNTMASNVKDRIMGVIKRF